MSYTGIPCILFHCKNPNKSSKQKVKVSHQIFSIFPSSQYHPQRYSLLFIWWISFWSILLPFAYIYSADFHIYEKLFFPDTILSPKYFKCEILYFLYWQAVWVKEGSPLRDGGPKLDSWLYSQRMENTLSIF